MPEPVLPPRTEIRCVPRWFYWAGWSLPVPLVFPFAFLLVGLPMRAVLGESWTLLHSAVAGGVLTAVVIAVAIKLDLDTQHCTLGPEELVLGQGRRAVRIPLDSIDRVVRGLPRLSATGRALVVVNKADRTYLGLAEQRDEAVVLVLDGGRYLPLSLERFWLRDGRPLIAELLRVTAARAAGPESWTPEEQRFLGRVRTKFNRVHTLRGRRPRGGGRTDPGSPPGRGR